MSDYEKHPLYQAVAMSAASSASYGYGSFIETLATYLKTFIDSPEERQQVTQVALMAYDRFISPRLGPVVGPLLRDYVGATINRILATMGG